jgi:hypothetical protein
VFDSKDNLTITVLFAKLYFLHAFAFCVASLSQKSFQKETKSLMFSNQS